MWMTRTKARGNYYYYLAIYNSYFDRKEENLYSLGRTGQAINTLQEWMNDKHKIPEYVKESGINDEKMNKWLSKLKRTSVMKWTKDDFKKEYAHTETIYT